MAASSDAGSIMSPRAISTPARSRPAASDAGRTSARTRLPRDTSSVTTCPPSIPVPPTTSTGPSSVIAATSSGIANHDLVAAPPPRRQPTSPRQVSQDHTLAGRGRKRHRGRSVRRGVASRLGSRFGEGVPPPQSSRLNDRGVFRIRPRPPRRLRAQDEPERRPLVFHGCLRGSPDRPRPHADRRWGRGRIDGQPAHCRPSGRGGRRTFAYEEPYYRAGVFGSLLLCRFRNVLGRTMWDFTEAVDGYGRFLVITMDESDPAPVT